MAISQMLSGKTQPLLNAIFNISSLLLSTNNPIIDLFSGHKYAFGNKWKYSSEHISKVNFVLLFFLISLSFISR